MSRISDHHNQFVIRFPEDIAQKLNAYFDAAASQGINPDQLNNLALPKAPTIELQMDRNRKNVAPRIALKVKIDGRQHKATVMDLPTISSTFKTLDRVNFFKSNDVSEMIVVHEEEDDIETIRQDQAEPIKGKDDKIIRYECQSGLTQPTKHIRQNNFKPKPKITSNFMETVDNELEIIRASSQPSKGEERPPEAKKNK